MTTTWMDRPLLAFDVESTGVDPHTDRIVTATTVWLAPGEEPRILEWLVNPGVPIPAAATAVHGITTTRAREDGADPAQAVDEIAGVLAHALTQGVPVVAMNAAYDLTMLEAETRRHGLTPLTDRGTPIAPVIDPLVIDRGLDKYRKGKRTLTALAEHYDITLTNAHDATADATAAGHLALALARRYPLAVGSMPLDVLHNAQTVWHRQWAENFRAWLTRQGKPADGVSGHWPLTPAPAAHEAVA